MLNFDGLLHRALLTVLKHRYCQKKEILIERGIGLRGGDLIFVLPHWRKQHSRKQAPYQAKVRHNSLPPVHKSEIQRDTFIWKIKTHLLDLQQQIGNQ